MYEYLLLRYEGVFSDAFPAPPYDAAQFQLQVDSFQKYYEKPSNRFARLSPPAYQFRGERLPRRQMAVLEGRMPLDQVLACARRAPR